MKRLAALALGLLAACTGKEGGSVKRPDDSVRQAVSSPPKSFDSTWVTIAGEVIDTAPGVPHAIQGTSDLDGKTYAVGVTLRADHPLEVDPSLAIRCYRGKTEVMLVGNEMFETERSLASVRYRFGEDGPVTGDTWLEGTGYKAIFAPVAVPIAKRLASSRRFRIEYTPFHGSTHTASYRTAALDTALRAVRVACKW